VRLFLGCTGVNIAWLICVKPFLEYHGMAFGVKIGLDSFRLNMINKIKNKVSLPCNKDIFKVTDFQQCLTSADIVDEQIYVTPLDISKERAVINVDADVNVINVDFHVINIDACSAANLTVKYKYKRKVFMTQAIVIPAVSDCLNLNQSVWSEKFTNLTFKLSLFIFLLVLPSVGLIFVCKKKKKNTSPDTKNTVIPSNSNLPRNRVDIQHTRNDLAEVI
jgi:hypothetical protein